jgi:hypothetical protein
MCLCFAMRVVQHDCQRHATVLRGLPCGERSGSLAMFAAMRRCSCSKKNKSNFRLGAPFGNWHSRPGVYPLIWKRIRFSGR